MLLQYAFKDSSEGVYIHTRANGKLFSIAHLCANTKVRRVLIRELRFADDTALASHTEAGLQQIVNHLSHTIKEFGLTISLKKTSWPRVQTILQLPPLTGTSWWKTSPTLGLLLTIPLTQR